MDLSELTLLNEPIEFIFNDPITNLPTDMKFRVIGQDSDQFLAYKRKEDNKKLKRLQKFNGRFTQSMEEIDADSLAMTAACIVGWSGLVYNGEPYAFTNDNAIQLLKAYPPIRDQIEDFVKDRTNFFEKS
jgi:hypothetical protein